MYRRPDRAAVRDEATLRRIKSIVIPPAWTNVWICPSPDGHIQATGRDSRGRKQYRYHPRFREIRDETKYHHILAFAAVLPLIRARVDADLKRPGLARERVLATIVRLLDVTLIRVGNEEYARANASFGLTTLRTRHVDIHGQNIRFHFRGKGGVEHCVEVHDRRLARVIARCTDLPGQLLFRYIDDEGELRSVESSEVNDYIRSVSGADFTAKDFRTWAGTVLAAKALQSMGVVQAIKDVAARLRNTAAVCKRCYVHPDVLAAHAEGKLHLRSTRRKPTFSAEEMAVLSMLKSRAKVHKITVRMQAKAA